MDNLQQYDLLMANGENLHTVIMRANSFQLVGQGSVDFFIDGVLIAEFSGVVALTTGEQGYNLMKKKE